jgi:hypothetical protein
MKKKITTFSFPEQFVRELKSLAALEGISMTEYIIKAAKLKANIAKKEGDIDQK